MSTPRIVHRKPVKQAKRYRKPEEPRQPGNGFGYLIGMIVLLLLANALTSHLALKAEEDPIVPVEADAEARVSYTSEMQAERERLIARLLAEGRPQSLKEMVQEAAKAEGIPPRLLLALVHVESSGNPKVISPKGACGLTQLMPATAKELGVKNCRDPHQNLRGGAKYLRQQWDRFGDPVTALVAFNWGPGNAEKWRARGARWKELPEETRRYVPKINARMELASLK